MTLTLSDLLILIGTAIALTGCWMLGIECGLIGTGIVVCLTGRVVWGVSSQRKGRR
jgi:hypothetical protein